MVPTKEQWTMPGAVTDAAAKRPAATDRWAGDGAWSRIGRWDEG